MNPTHDPSARPLSSADGAPVELQATLSEVEQQMDRIRQAQKRIRLSSQALAAGLFDSASPAAAPQPSFANDPSQARVLGMGRAMSQVLQQMQDQAVADIAEVSRQHQALRRYQTELARQQLGSAPQPSRAAEHDAVIDVQATPVKAPADEGNPG